MMLNKIINYIKKNRVIARVMLFLITIIMTTNTVYCIPPIFEKEPLGIPDDIPIPELPPF